MQIKEKAIENNAVTETKIRLSNNTNLRARNFAGTGDINILKVNSSDLVEFTTKPQSSFTPSAGQDLATVTWVQEFVAGMTNLKDACECATTANISLAPAPLVIDTHTLLIGSRVLVKDQSTASENGIYVFDGTNLNRASDFDDSPSSEVKQGSSCDVINGFINGNKRFILTNSDPVIGVTGLVFVEIPTGAIVPVEQEEILTMNGTDISNQYKDLSKIVLHSSVKVYFSGVMQTKSTDYTLSDVGGVTRVTFSGDLASGGNIALVSTDKLTVCYEAE